MPIEEQEFGLHVGGHVMFIATFPTPEHPEGEVVSRKYTPISQVHDKGTIVFPIKIYRKNVHPNFPDGGKMTQYLESLKLGDKVKIEGPRGSLEYLGKGNFKISDRLCK